jgi:hypothetical protein
MRKLLFPALACVMALTMSAADETRLHIHVVNAQGKPVGNAEVIVKFLEGRLLKTKKHESWELRTTQEGTVSTPGIPFGKILVQINAHNYQTYGETYDVAEPEKDIEIKLKAPQSQYSSDPSPPPLKN